MSASMIRVVVVDRQELFRRGVAMLLQSLDGIEVLAHGAAVDAVTAETDVVVLDANSPGLGACAELREVVPEARILMLTDDADGDPFAAMGAGALGMLHKDTSLEELVEGIRVVADGHTLVSPSMTERMVSGFREAEAAQNGRGRLTARESEVLQLVAGGLSNREIGMRLGIAENTAKNHVRNLLEKLQLRSRTEAAMYAVREKLIEP